MNTEKPKKKTYMIAGRTTKGNFVTVGFADSIKWAVEYFIEKYPRFNGNAEIRTQMATDLGNGILCADYGHWETIDSFQSTKELKEYLGKQI